MKNLIVVTLIASMMAATMLGGCASGNAGQGSGQEAAAQEQTQEPAAEEAEPAEDQAADAQPAAEAQEDVLEPAADTVTAGEEYPAFVFTGEDPYMQPIFTYFEENIKDMYPEADIFLPEFDIFREDDSDPEDIKVWGNFWVSKYNYRGTTLMAMSGGSYPGCMHLKADGDGYVVTSAEFVEDGTNYDDSLKKIFSDDELMAAFQASGDDMMDVRANTAHSYAEQTGLNIRAYQDYGWDPVQISPEDADFAMDLQYPDIAGTWSDADQSTKMEVTLPDSGSTFQFDITTAGADTTEDHYSIYATYEMGTQTFWYWDCWVNDEQSEDEAVGCLVVNEDNTITWNHGDGDAVVLVRAQ